ncbi:MAG: diguanylate cyclase [Ignavibacteriae bacterium HGW-Ignavibacteriae-3]|nr:MAG: diguanylate cyclase [Ignavibacteriae bacterium HGW-Ignavibacteriae-3]
MNSKWIKEFPIAVTICDNDGTITEMNDKAAETFKDDGGYGLIGKNLLGCHSDESNEKIRKIMESEKPNIYTIEKNGKKKLIYQAPWFEGGKMNGLVELSIEIPHDAPHFIRE